MVISAEKRKAGWPTPLLIRDLLTSTPVKDYHYPCATQQTPSPRRPQPPQVRYNSAHPDAWNNLPQEFTEAITTSIYKNLTYLELCRLAMVSRVFGDTVTAFKDEVPKADKQEAIREAETHFFQHHLNANKRAENDSRGVGGRALKQGTPESPSPEAATDSKSLEGSPNYACYECCCLIQHSYFDQNQPFWIIRHADGRMSRYDGASPELSDTMESPRRFCASCGVNLGFYRSGDQITTLSSQRLWICSCLRVNTKGNILTPRMYDRCGKQCLHLPPRQGPARTRRPSARTRPY